MIGTKTMKKFIIIIVLILSSIWIASCNTKTTYPSDKEIPSENNTNLPENPKDNLDIKEITKMYITINENKLEVNLAENSSVDALIEILKQKDIIYTANDYGGFEKVGSLGFSLPTSNSQITTEAGDVILYSGNQIVLFYGSNSWSYTRLGKIVGYSAAELRSLLCAGTNGVQITLSLN